MVGPKPRKRSSTRDLRRPRSPGSRRRHGIETESASDTAISATAVTAAAAMVRQRSEREQHERHDDAEMRLVGQEPEQDACEHAAGDRASRMPPMSSTAVRKPFWPPIPLISVAGARTSNSERKRPRSMARSARASRARRSRTGQRSRPQARRNRAAARAARRANRREQRVTPAMHRQQPRRKPRRSRRDMRSKSNRRPRAAAERELRPGPDVDEVAPERVMPTTSRPLRPASRSPSAAGPSRRESTGSATRCADRRTDALRRACGVSIGPQPGRPRTESRAASTRASQAGTSPA